MLDEETIVLRNFAIIFTLLVTLLVIAFVYGFGFNIHSKEMPTQQQLNKLFTEHCLMIKGIPKVDSNGIVYCVKNGEFIEIP